MQYSPTPRAKYVALIQLSRQHTGQDAQVTTDDIEIHRESISSQLSVDTSDLLKGLCISIAACVTYPCTGEFEATSKQIMEVIMMVRIMI